MSGKSSNVSSIITGGAGGGLLFSMIGGGGGVLGMAVWIGSLAGLNGGIGRFERDILMSKVVTSSGNSNTLNDGISAGGGKEKTGGGAGVFSISGSTLGSSTSVGYDGTGGIGILSKGDGGSGGSGEFLSVFSAPLKGEGKLKLLATAAFGGTAANSVKLFDLNEAASTEPRMLLLPRDPSSTPEASLLSTGLLSPNKLESPSYTFLFVVLSSKRAFVKTVFFTVFEFIFCSAFIKDSCRPVLALLLNFKAARLLTLGTALMSVIEVDLVGAFCKDSIILFKLLISFLTRSFVCHYNFRLPVLNLEEADLLLLSWSSISLLLPTAFSIWILCLGEWIQWHLLLLLSMIHCPPRADVANIDVFQGCVRQGLFYCHLCIACLR